MQTLLLAADPISHVVQHTALDLNPHGGVFSFPIISNHILMQMLGAVLLIWLIPKVLANRAGSDAVNRLVPRGMGNFIELICVALRENIFRPNLGKYTDLFTPFLWSLFFFILIANVLGLFPLADWFGAINPSLGHLIGGTSTANFYVTGALAAMVLAMVVFNGLRFHGMGYVKHFFMGPWWIAWFIAPLEVMGVVFKCGALCIRLTANMLAGHILLAVLLSFVGKAYSNLGTGGGTLVAAAVVAGSVAIYFLEILVAFLHAFIFTTLTTVFLGLAVNIHHDEEHEHHEEHAHGEPHAAPAHV